jgi:hypothetical protein
MKKIIIPLLLTFIASCAFSQAAFRIDHTTASLFENIPSEYAVKAATIRHMFRHASVGTTIDGGLNCLQGTKNRCTEYPQYQYDRRNWAFQIRPNSGWFGKINDFALEVRRQIDSFDVFAFKYCYLDGLDMVAEPCGSPLKEDRVTTAWETLRDTMLALESAFPQKKFIWWTIPLTQIGQRCTDELNAKIRSYCQQNGKILFDLADIESHDTAGIHTVNTEGYELAFKPYCGEQKEDAQACHPNDFGSSIIAKAFWVMMAQLSGWEPGVQAVHQNKSKTGLYLLPNPAVEYVDITLAESLDQFDRSEIQIYTSAGMLVPYPAAILTTIDGLRLYISEFPAGMYIVTLGQEKGSFIKQ